MPPALRLSIAAALAVTIALLFRAFLVSAPAQHTLRIGILTEPNSLSPLLGLNDFEQFADRLIFDVLISTDPDGRLVPRLAERVPSQSNGGISRDGLTITYHLRHNVRWQDGASFTSRDVVFSYAALMNPANNVPNRHGYDQIATLRAPDAYTVVVRMKHRYAPVLTNLFSDASPNPILPAHLLERYPDLNRVPFNEHPVGTGPYKVVRWDRGQSLELAANDTYYLGRPHIANISVRFIPDEATMLNELRTHELDAIVLASVHAFEQIKAMPRVKYALVNYHAASNVLINNTHPELKDVRVRRAIAYAIDKAAIVEKFTYGAGTVATADLPSFMWAYEPRVRRYGYDPGRARELLRQAGWVAPHGGIAHKDGRALSLTYAFEQNNASAGLIAVQMQAYMRAVGIDLVLRPYTTAVMFGGYANGGIYQTGNFDLAWYTMTLSIDPDSSGRFMCNAIPPNGQNYSRYCSATMDAAQKGGLESFDRASRKAAYGRSQRALADDVPIVFVLWPKDVEAYDARLRGFKPNAVTASWNAQDWSW